MSQVPHQARAIEIKPQPNVYTVLVIVAVLALAGTVGVSLYYLLSGPPNGCGLSLGELFGQVKLPGAGG